MSALAFLLQVAQAPASPEVLDAIQEIEVDVSVEEASMFRLRLGIARTLQGDWSLLQDDLFRPLTPVTVRVQAGVGTPQAIINGFVSNQRVNYADDPGQSTVEVTGMDTTRLMNLNEKVAQWPNQPDSSIAASIFQEYHLAPQVQPTSPVLVAPEGTTTQRSTDIRFLRQLARRHGFACYVQPEPTTGLEVGVFQPPDLQGPPQAVLSVSMGEETNVGRFQVRYEMLRPTTALASNLDALTKRPQPASAQASAQPLFGREGALARIPSPPVARLAAGGLVQQGDLQALAQSVVDRAGWAVLAEGTVGPEAGVLRPGKTVSLRGAGRVFNGSYYVTRISHRITREGYEQRFEARRNAVQMTGTEVYVEW